MNSIFNPSRVVAVAVCGLALVACDSIKNVSEKDYAALPPPQMLLGGTISGLGNSPVVLQNNGAGNRSFSTTSILTMGSVPMGSTYNITVLTQPQNRTCTVVNGSGTASAAVSNVQVNCVLNEGVAAYTVGGTISGDAIGKAGLQVKLSTLDGTETINIGAGTTTFTFALPVINLNGYTVTATYPGTAGVTNNCGAVNGVGEINGANVTNVNVNTCVFTIGGVAGFNGPPTPFGAGGVTLALRNSAGTELESVNVASAGAFSFLTPRISNAVALYTVEVTEHPAGQHCLVRNAGTASLATAANVNLTVTCGALPALAATLTGTYRLGTQQTYLSLFSNGTFLYAVRGATAAESGVEHGFYSLGCCGPGSLFFIVTTDSNGAAGLSSASADGGFVLATGTVKSAGPPATIAFTAGGVTRTLTAVTSTDGQLDGAWVGTSSPRMLVYNKAAGTAFHAGANGAGNLQSICLSIDNPAAATGTYVQDRNAQCRPSGVAILDTSPAWFTGGLPGAPRTPQRASEPSNYTVTAGSGEAVDTLTLQGTYEGAVIGVPVGFSRSAPN